MGPLLNASIGQLVPSIKEYYDKTGPMNGIKSAREKANITGVQKLKNISIDYRARPRNQRLLE
jgi:hypothetical protein